MYVLKQKSTTWQHGVPQGDRMHQCVGWALRAWAQKEYPLRVSPKQKILALYASGDWCSFKATGLSIFSQHKVIDTLEIQFDLQTNSRAQSGRISPCSAPRTPNSDELLSQMDDTIHLFLKPLNWIKRHFRTLAAIDSLRSSLEDAQLVLGYPRWE